MAVALRCAVVLTLSERAAAFLPVDDGSRRRRLVRQRPRRHSQRRGKEIEAAIAAAIESPGENRRRFRGASLDLRR